VEASLTTTGRAGRPGVRASAARAASFTVRRIPTIVDTSTCHLRAASAWVISPRSPARRSPTSSPRTASSVAAAPSPRPWTAPLNPIEETTSLKSFRGGPSAPKSDAKHGHRGDGRRGSPAQLACRVLDVSESGFYAWRSRAPSELAIRHAWLTDLIRQIHVDLVSLNARFRKAVAHRGHFPNEQSALKVLYLVATERRPNRSNPTGRITAWKGILNALTIHYGDRIQAAV
jgi:Transposase, Mutator family